jgi:type IV secretory pathway VirB2 component (pilin)
MSAFGTHLGSLGLAVMNAVPATAKPLPPAMVDALDTVKLWVGIFAGAMAIIALILIGVGMMFAHNQRDGGQKLQEMGKWIAGCVLVGGAAGLAAVFLPGSS